MKLLSAFGFVAILNIFPFGQSAPDDIDRLRQFLNIPDLVKIRIATSDTLVRDKAALRVFIATGTDASARKKYERHVKNWNKSRESERSGKLALVKDLFSADVALVKQSFPNRAQTQTVPIVTSSPVYDPVTRSTVNRTTSNNHTIRAVPFQVHILRRTADGIEIVRAISSVEVFRERERDGTGDNLWEMFRELLVH